MSTKPETIRFDPQPLKVGVEWHILATYPAGQREYITGFKNEKEAVDWIDGPQCREWVKARGYQ